MSKNIRHSLLAGLASQISTTIEVCGVLTAIEELQSQGYNPISAIEQLIAFGRDIPNFGGKKLRKYIPIPQETTHATTT